METLELYLSPIDAKQFKAIVTKSPVGEGETESSLPFFEGEKDWRITLLRCLEMTAFNSQYFQQEEQEWMVKSGILNENRNAFDAKYLVNIGQEAYHSLFRADSKAKNLLLASLRLSEEKHTQLHIRLTFAADVVQRSRLADYPWELLHDGEKFLLHRNVTISRYIAYESVPPKLPPTDKLNVLLVSSSGWDSELELKQMDEQETQAIRKGLKKARDAGHINFVELEDATRDQLRVYLTEHRGEDAPHVLHFDGHGLFGKRCSKPECCTMHKGNKPRICRKCNTVLPEPQGYLVFEDLNKKADYVSAEELGTLLRQSSLGDGSNKSGGIALVVLSACQSAMTVEGDSVFNGTAQNLISHRIPSVVAMHYSVEIQAAAQFAEQFYRSLGQKNSLALVVNQGREAMGVKSNQWYRPVLYLRWQDNKGGQLFSSTTSVDHLTPNEGDDKVYIRNPPKLDKPVGRQKELVFYLQQLLDPDQRSIFIIGLAGIGKTTLAAKLHHLMTPDGADYWAELAEHDLDGSLPPKSISYSSEQMLWADLAEKDSSDGFLAACAEIAKKKQATETESILLSQAHSLEVKLEVLTEFLDQHIQVIFLDDFHKLKNQSLIELLSEQLLQRLGRTKLVFMSRRQLLIDTSEPLKGLDEASSLYLIRKLIPSLTFSDEQVAPLVRRYEGHPEALKLIAGLLKRRKTPEDLLKRLSVTWADPYNRLRKLLQTLFDDLSPEHQEIASLLAIVRPPITEDFTDNLYLDFDADIQFIIWELQEYFVVESEQNYIIENDSMKELHFLRMHDLVRDFCNAVSKAHHERLHQNALETWIKVIPKEIQQLIDQAAQPAWPFFPEGWDKRLLSNNQIMPHLQQLEILLEAFHHAPLAGKNTQWTAFLFIVDRYLHRWGMMGELMKHIEQLEEANIPLVPQLKFRKARILNEWHREQEALSILLTILDEDWSKSQFSEDDQFLIPTVAYVDLGGVYANLKNSNEAIKNYEIALSRYRIIGEAKGLSRTYALLGDEYTEIGRYDDAKENYSQAIKLNIDNQQWYYAALNLRRLGDISFLSGDLATARNHLSESCRLVEAHSLANQGADYARIRFSLAKVLLASEPELVDIIKQNLLFAADVFERQRLDEEKAAVDEILSRMAP